MLSSSPPASISKSILQSLEERHRHQCPVSGGELVSSASCQLRNVTGTRLGDIFVPQLSDFRGVTFLLLFRDESTKKPLRVNIVIVFQQTHLLQSVSPDPGSSLFSICWVVV